MLGLIKTEFDTTGNQGWVVEQCVINSTQEQRPLLVGKRNFFLFSAIEQHSKQSSSFVVTVGSVDPHNDVGITSLQIVLSGEKTHL